MKAIELIDKDNDVCADKYNRYEPASQLIGALYRQCNSIMDVTPVGLLGNTVYQTSILQYFSTDQYHFLVIRILRSRYETRENK